MARLLLLLAALGLTGCVFGDCPPDGSEIARTTDAVSVAAPAVGDTLTVAFVQGDGSFTEFGGSLQPAVGDALSATPDGTVRLGLDVESVVFGDEAPYGIDAVAVGDTVYVYLAGSLDPSVFSQACSYLPPGASVWVTSVAAPPAVRAVRDTHLYVGDLPTAVADGLRQRAAHRTISV